MSNKNYTLTSAKAMRNMRVYLRALRIRPMTVPELAEHLGLADANRLRLYINRMFTLELLEVAGWTELAANNKRTAIYRAAKTKREPPAVKRKSPSRPPVAYGEPLPRRDPMTAALFGPAVIARSDN